MRLDEHITGMGPRERRPRRAVVLVGALALAMLAIPWFLPVPDAVESAAPDGSRWLRVELPELHERGPDAAVVVEALQRHGVPIEVTYGRHVIPWKAGRIIAVGGSLGASPEAVQRKAAGAPIDLTEVDLTEYGIRYHPDGGYSVGPARFRGSVSLRVGLLPWQRVP